MQSELPKQFMLLLDLPVLMHTMERFAAAFDEEIELVLVLPEEHVAFWKNQCQQMDFDIDHQVVVGGETRFESVRNGLNALRKKGVVGIHDGVRPLLSEALIKTCFEEAEKHGSALPVVDISQSLRKVNDNASSPVDREGIVAVQTPQCFQVERILQAYDQNYQPAFTDDATVFEAAGNKIHLVDGEEWNIKITTPADLKIAEAILAGSAKR